MAALNTPLYIDPFIGWRGWRIRNGRLRSTNFPVEWEPGRAMTSWCGSLEDHESPHKDCTCGIHATDTLEHLRLNFLVPGLPAVYGRVKLWGRVVRHAHGFRAEFAYPAELFVQDESHVEALEMYGVPVVAEWREAA